MNNTGIIYGINGPVVYLKGKTGFRMSEMGSCGRRASGGRGNRPDERQNHGSGI